MLARFFQKSKPISFISLLILLFFYVMIHRFRSFFPSFDMELFLWSLGVFVFFTLVILLVDFIISKNQLTGSHYFTLFIFIFLLGIFPDVLHISKYSLAHLFILLGFRRLYSLRTRKKIMEKLFDSGFYLGIAFLFYPVNILFFVLIYIGYFIYIQVFDKRLWIPVLGFLTPVFLTFTYFFITDQTAYFKTLTEINMYFNPNKYDDLHLLIPVLAVSFLVLIALIKNMGKLSQLDNKSKKGFQLVISTLIIAVLTLVVNNQDLGQSIQFVFFPIAVLLGSLIEYTRKKWLREIVVYGLLIFSIQLLFW